MGGKDAAASREVMWDGWTRKQWGKNKQVRK